MLRALSVGSLLLLRALLGQLQLCASAFRQASSADGQDAVYAIEGMVGSIVLNVHKCQAGAAVHADWKAQKTGGESGLLGQLSLETEFIRMCLLPPHIAWVSMRITVSLQTFCSWRMPFEVQGGLRFISQRGADFDGSVTPDFISFRHASDLACGFVEQLSAAGYCFRVLAVRLIMSRNSDLL